MGIYAHPTSTALTCRVEEPSTASGADIVFDACALMLQADRSPQHEHGSAATVVITRLASIYAAHSQRMAPVR